MATGKTALGMVCSLLLFFLLHIPGAFAAEPKPALAHKKDKTRARAKAKTAIVKTKKSRDHARKQRAVRRVAFHPAPAVPSAGDRAGLNLTRDPLMLNSNAALALDQSNGLSLKTSHVRNVSRRPRTAFLNFAGSCRTEASVIAVRRAASAEPE